MRYKMTVTLNILCSLFTNQAMKLFIYSSYSPQMAA